MAKLIPTAIGSLLALGTYVALAQFINTEACGSVERMYESAMAARIFAQIVLVCI